ncbi:MAG: hypothetical protein ACJ779_03855 [Chloroflexota bacterium]
MDGMQRYRTKARFQLAVAQLAGDRFAEAADGLAEAEAWFEERGAGWLPRAYRQDAVRPPASRSTGDQPSDDSGRSTPVPEASLAGDGTTDR